jgi:transposase
LADQGIAGGWALGAVDFPTNSGRSQESVDSPRGAWTMGKKRRQYTAEFKAEAVKLVTEQGYTLLEAARSLGIDRSLLGYWKKQLSAAEENATLTEDEQMELKRLREENRRLRMERDILKKAAAFFANDRS